MHYSVGFSGGKDSTATIILAHIHNEPIDSIVFAEVMFDKYKGISGENPRHIEFIKNVAIPTFESWGYKVTIVRGEKDYLDVFNAIMERPTKCMEHKGKKYGFCISGMCSVKRECKMKPIKEFYESIKDEVMSYVGIAIDEQKRLESLHKNTHNISLLEKYGYTEDMARALCREYGLLSPGYVLSKRGGCWMCPNSKILEHKEIRNTMPDAWKQFIALEDDVEHIANDKWNPYTKQTLHEREEILKWDDAQMNIFDFISETNEKGA